jgi:hypothetical protein
MVIVHAIGNSHVNVFTGHDSIFGDDSIDLFKTHCIGPTIAYNFYQHYYPSVLEYVKACVDKNNDYIMLIVGEVDCRWHLPKQAQLQDTPVDVLVKDCIDRFFKCHLDLKKQGYKVIGWGGHPSTTSGHDDTPHCPVYGDCLYRNTISKTWSTCLQELCAMHDVAFISIVNDLLDDDSGLTKMEYFIDYCHLKSSMVLNLIFSKVKEIIGDINPKV